MAAESSMASVVRWGWALALLMLPAGLMGCQVGQRLRVTTVPPGAMVAVKDSGGRIVKTHASPVDVSLRYGPGREHYVVEATPLPADAERYRVTTEEISEARYSDLPEVRKSY